MGLFIEAIIEKLSKNRFFGDMLSRQSIGQFKRYLVTGFLSFGIEYALFNLLFQTAGLWYIWASTIALSVVFWFNFLMNRLWSFKSTTSLKIQLPLYTLLFGFNILATNLLIYLLSDKAGIHPSLSKLLVMGAVVSWNFILYRKIIYR